MKKNKIAIICNTDGALYNFRKPLIQMHVNDGWEVHTYSNDYGNYFQELKNLKCEPNFVNFYQNNSLKQNIILVIRIISLLRKLKPDVIHIYTLQPIILLSIPLWICGFKNIFSTITGMGRNFDIYDKPLSKRQKFILFILKISLIVNKKIHVQNNFDKEFLLKYNVTSEIKLHKVNGSGIDISNRSNDLKISEQNIDFCKKMNIGLDKKIILFAARGLKQKGLHQFAETSKIISSLSSDFLFLHAGGFPDNMTVVEYEDYAKNHNFLSLGYVKEIHNLFRIADIVVLPSLYREGTPKSLIEAIYFNKIIITNDIPGCNETVIDGANGFLTSPGNTNDLVSKILKTKNLDLSLVKKTNDFLLQKYDIVQIYDLNKRMYSN